MFLLAFWWPRFFKDFLLKLAKNSAQKKAQKAWNAIYPLSKEMGNYRKIHAKIGSIAGESAVDKLRKLNSIAPQA